MKAVMPTTWLLLSCLTMAALHLLLPVISFIPSAFRLLGAVPLLAGVLINTRADLVLRRACTTIRPFQPPTALATDGVYRLSRNPMYLGFVWILFGVAALLGSLTPFLVVPPFFILMDLGYIPAEERALSSRFGHAWQEYQRQVGRWITLRHGWSPLAKSSKTARSAQSQASDAPTRMLCENGDGAERASSEGS